MVAQNTLSDTGYGASVFYPGRVYPASCSDCGKDDCLSVGYTQTAVPNVQISCWRGQWIANTVCKVDCLFKLDIGMMFYEDGDGWESVAEYHHDGVSLPLQCNSTRGYYVPLGRPSTGTATCSNGVMNTNGFTCVRETKSRSHSHRSHSVSHRSKNKLAQSPSHRSHSHSHQSKSLKGCCYTPPAGAVYNDHDVENGIDDGYEYETECFPNTFTIFVKCDTGYTMVGRSIGEAQLSCNNGVWTGVSRTHTHTLSISLWCLCESWSGYLHCVFIGGWAALQLVLSGGVVDVSVRL